MALNTNMDGDAELKAIRAKRLADLRGNLKGEDNASKEEEKRRAAEEYKNGILSQILDQDARARLNTIMVAKPEKAQMVENILIQMAQRGQIMGRMSEEDLKNILEQVNKQFQPSKTTVKFDRRRAALDDSDEELDV